MSAFAQAALISGSIFTVVMASQYGRREYRVKDLIRPLAMVAGFGWFYLKGMPTSSHELPAYAVAVALGLVFGAGATLVTRVERDPWGRIFTRCGPAFAGIWLLAVVLRLGFVWAVIHIEAVRQHFGEFMLTHHISLDAIAPFFVLWALTMVVSRVAVVAGRAHALSNRLSRPVREAAFA